MNKQTSFMASWLQRGSTVASNKRKSTDTKDTNAAKEEDETKASKMRKEKY